MSLSFKESCDNPKALVTLEELLKSVARNQELLETEAKDCLKKELLAKKVEMNSVAKGSAKLLEINLESKNMLEQKETC